MSNPFQKPSELQVSEAVRRLNPQLFGARQVGAEKPQPQAQPALEREPQGREGGKDGAGVSGPLYRVSILSLRRRLCDGDNLAGGCKPLRDAIAALLGCDDSERFIQWEYAQVETRGEQETLVRIEIL